MFQRFLPLWIEEAKSGRRSIVRVLLKNCWKQWLVSFILTLVSQMLQLVVPTLIATITEYLTSSPRELGGTGGTIWEGLGYVAVVAGVCMVMSVCGGVGMILLQQMTLWFRHFLQMLIYQKALGMRSSDIKDQGKCLNLISTDANAFIHVFHMVNAVLTSPALLAASIYLLYHANGWVGLLTALIIALLFPITLYITQQVAKNTRIYQARSDTRIKLTNELIHGIRIIKYYVWEKPFMKRIDDARERELSTLVANGILKTLNMTVSMSTSSIALLVTFAIDGAVLGNEITPAKVFTSYSVISTIRQAFHQIGMFLNSYVMLSVAMGRIGSFITATDIGAAPEKMYTPVRSQLKGKDDDDEKSIDEADVENEDSIPLISRAQKEEEEEKEKEEEEGEMSGEDMVEFDGNDNDDVAVSLKDATYVWGDDAEAISHANMEVRKGELFMIIGSVGSGKSALIYSMLDELKCKSGSCTIRGSIAYVPQKPWILVNKKTYHI